ncbi:NAD(P)-binding protein [Punctularia strigosozonata HHB-11173 SS5]|uniref:NAD(P)-binding protein n=1 Tax=Punctularia strigosozonata (strain HHB-11173) TaxID=741275 RepID=R7S1W2_PUNST|nr:NAD(P)-binding protein [Punctularia strigosozonata HHB-11173 SS5]EIN03752.1 NAD(P)-binding protein [Punctularia strigosozonata HHB-11173 SS5]
MSTIHKVAVAGASGNIGSPVVEQLLAAKFEVIALSRSGDSSKLPSGVTVRKVDYDSVESLVAALKDVNAVVSTVGAAAVPSQTTLIDAASIAGVKRFIPSEYGGEMEDPAYRAIFAPKVAVQDHLEKVSAESGLTWTIVLNGPFLDRGLRSGFLLDPLNERKAEIFDGGDKPFSSTTMATIGKAVASILLHPEETKNRYVRIHDAVVTQSKLLNIAKELTPGTEWSVTHSKAVDLQSRADGLIAQGISDMRLWALQIKYWLSAQHTKTVFKELDNELLGVGSISEEELREIVKSAL